MVIMRNHLMLSSQSPDDDIVDKIDSHGGCCCRLCWSFLLWERNFFAMVIMRNHLMLSSQSPAGDIVDKIDSHRFGHEIHENHQKTIPCLPWIPWQKRSN